MAGKPTLNKLAIGIIIKFNSGSYKGYFYFLSLPGLSKVNRPHVANAGGLQSPGVKGEVVVFYFERLTTQNLKSSGVPEG